MRDLGRYPVTKEEVLKCLTEITEEIEKQELIGDMRPMLLKIATGVVMRHYDD